MKKLALFFSIIALSTVGAMAQKSDDSNAALAVINKLWEAMAAHKPADIVALHTAEAQLVAIRTTRDGKTMIRTMKAEDFSKGFAEKRAELWEDMYAPKVEVTGDFAQVWGRYVFFVNGKVSHCGVNSFHLVKVEGAWKIAGAASTMDAQSCTEEEKARKAPTPAVPATKQ